MRQQPPSKGFFFSKQTKNPALFESQPFQQETFNEHNMLSAKMLDKTSSAGMNKSVLERGDHQANSQVFKDYLNDDSIFKSSRMQKAKDIQISPQHMLMNKSPILNNLPSASKRYTFMNKVKGHQSVRSQSQYPPIEMANLSTSADPYMEMAKFSNSMAMNLHDNLRTPSKPLSSQSKHTPTSLHGASF